MNYPDAHLRKVLTAVKTIAAVGMSPNPIRPSHFVGSYLSGQGYRVIPVNPKIAGEPLFGEVAVADLADLTEPVDMIDIFRTSDAVPGIVEAALRPELQVKVIWMQFGVMHAEATARAEAAGLTVIQDRCPKLEHQRLFGQLRIAGFNTGQISSKLRPVTKP